MQVRGFVFLMAMSACPAFAGVMTYTEGSLYGAGYRDAYPAQGDRYTSSLGATRQYGSFSASASADYGVLKVAAAGAANVPQISPSGPWPALPQNVAAFASASVSDSFTLSNSARTGTKGQLTVGFYSANVLTADYYSPYSYDGSFARYGLDVTLFSPYQGAHNGRLILNQSLTKDDDRIDARSSQWTDDATGIQSGEIGGTYFSLTQEFVWGTPIYYQMNMWADGMVANYTYPYFSDSHGSFSADGSQSTYWAGIQSVSVGGVEVSDFTLTSASGTDYAHSFVPQAADVPEPGSLALLALGLVSLIARRRKSAV